MSDTVYVGYAGGMYSVAVNNTGTGEVEMDWQVDDSLSQWVRLTGTASGVDDGMFTIVCDANPGENDRMDSIEIFAPETDLMSKTIYIVQTRMHGLSISAQVVPEDAGFVTGAGVYEQGDTVTLHAIAADSCRFVAWKLDDAVVSTEANYSFVVESDIHLTALFDCGGLSTPESNCGVMLIYPNPANGQLNISGSRIRTVRLYTALGQLAAQYDTPGNDHVTIDISSLKSGLYIVRVDTDTQTLTHKLIVANNSH